MSYALLYIYIYIDTSFQGFDFTARTSLNIRSKAH